MGHEQEVGGGHIPQHGPPPGERHPHLKNNLRKANRGELSRTCRGIHPRHTYTRKTIAGLDMIRGGTMLTIISIIPGSTAVSRER
jgi:hypothetical protein